MCSFHEDLSVARMQRKESSPDLGSCSMTFLSCTDPKGGTPTQRLQTEPFQNSRTFNQNLIR